VAQLRLRRSSGMEHHRVRARSRLRLSLPDRRRVAAHVRQAPT
jgi:hypothetical protein